MLSPLLFNIFLADLAKGLFSFSDKFELNRTKINSLFWADDIVLLAKSKEKLEDMLKYLSSYCSENKLTVNCKKTKCLIFNEGGRLIREKFYLNGNELENVREYKYLGFKLTASGEIKTGLKDLKDRALKAYFSLKNRMEVGFNQCVKTALEVYKSIVQPILLFTSDFWGVLKLPANNPVETVQMRIFKDILGVSKKTA